MSSGTLVCDECGLAREVTLTDDHDHVVTVEEYREALALVGARVLCGDCAPRVDPDAQPL